MEKKTYICPTMVVVKLQHRTHLMMTSQVDEVSGNVFEGSPRSDEGYTGGVRTRESSGVWDEEW